MTRFSRNQLLITAIATIVVLIGIGVFAFDALRPPAESPEGIQAGPPQSEGSGGQVRVIGTSVQGRPMEVYTYGQGDTRLLFVGGVHGGYEWNTVVLAYEFIDYFTENLEAIAQTITVSIIPSANPDGVYTIMGKEGRFDLADVPAAPTVPSGAGRFNANGVDLNRNFDCNWKSEGMWRGSVVNAGATPFSEPETQAIRDFVLEYSPEAVIFWHSQANAVYPGECGGDISAETRNIMNAYAGAAGYQTQDLFDAYEVTGSADGWLAAIGIPALTVELETHETVEWERNLEGVQALFEYYTP